MSDPSLLRLLDLVRRELGAEDARVSSEVEPPEDPRVVFCELPGGARLVAVMATAPSDRAQLREKLAVLAKSFSVSATGAVADWTALSGELASRRLDDELAALTDQAGAVRAVVIDAQSPVIWGTSEMRRESDDVDSLIQAADAFAAADKAGVDLAGLLEREAEEGRALLDARQIAPPLAAFLLREAERIRHESRRSVAAWRHHLLTARAVAAVRRERESGTGSSLREMVHEQGFGYLARSFANIYRLLLVFDAAYSELHAEGAVVHALPVIERLVLALPPVEPPPRGGRVLRLPLPRS